MEYEKLSEGSTVNVLYELELDGDEDIWRQLLKLLDDNANDPEQVVFEVLVVTEVVFIASEKVTEMLSLIETPLWLSVGEIDETVGAVDSTVKEVIVSVLLAFPAESVTIIVQLEKVPSLKEVRVIVLFPEIADVVLEEHEPP